MTDDLDEVAADPNDANAQREQTDKQYKMRAKLAWHGKMVLYPVVTMLSSTFMSLFGVGQVLLWRMSKANVCAGGPFAALRHLGPVDALLCMWYLIAYGGVMLTQNMLAVTHYRCYTKLARTSEERLRQDEEFQFPLLYGKRIYNLYLMAMGTQVLLYISIGLARDAAGMPELVFFMLWFGCYALGCQINLLDDYSLHTKFVKVSSAITCIITLTGAGMPMAAYLYLLSA